MIGKVEYIDLPQRGQWVRQGQKIWSVIRNGKKVDMVSPIEGSVADINEEDSQSGAGVQRSLRRRLAGDGAIARCQDQLPQPARRTACPLVDRRSCRPPATAFPMAIGALAQDGGVATHDLTQHIEGAEWSDVVREFFLT